MLTNPVSASQMLRLQTCATTELCFVSVLGQGQGLILYTTQGSLQLSLLAFAFGGASFMPQDCQLNGLRALHFKSPILLLHSL